MMLSTREIRSRGGQGAKTNDGQESRATVSPPRNPSRLVGAMIYEIVRSSGAQLTFVTAARARRGRGILFALAPAVVLSMAVSILFATSADQIFLWQVLRRVFLPPHAIPPSLFVP